MTKPQDDGEAVAPCTCGQSGHGNAHDPDCPRSDYKPIRSERQEAMAARDDGGYWDNSGRHHPARDDGMAVAWLRQILDGTSVKISSGDWRVENDHWHGITMSASFARALTRQLAEARAERDSARRGVAARLIYHRQSQKGQCCDDCYCVALANAISEYAEPSPTPPAPVVTEEMAIITGCNAWFEARLRRGLDTELRKCGYPSCTCTQTPTAIKAALSRQLADAQAERDRIIEDRARFPDRPDDIGRMIQAHIGNLKAGKEAADEHARNAFAKLQVVRADLAEAHGVIAALVADIEDYERVNNLAPSPGKRDCWQSVTHAKDVLAQSAALRTEK